MAGQGSGAKLGSDETASQYGARFSRGRAPAYRALYASDWVGDRPHQVPGFAILFKPGSFRTRHHTHHFAAFNYAGGKDVPKVFWKDACDQVINFLRCI